VKLIQALKKCKDLQRKIDDLRDKIKLHCADMDIEEPVYGTVEQQSKQVKEWIQSIHDSLKEILRLRVSIQSTNLSTDVSIVLEEGKKPVVHTIAEWIHRRRDLAANELMSWEALTNRGLQPQNYYPKGDRGKPEDIQLSKVRRYFDPIERDEKVELFKTEPSIIDAKLEVVNAETDLIE